MTEVFAAMLALLAFAGPRGEDLPSNISIPNLYRPIVTEMIRYSPTFRRQCSRLGHTAGLRIDVNPSLSIQRPAGEAFTRIVRRGEGLDADVQVGWTGDPITLIAHEFEHILEQLDGVDLPVMAGRPATGVRLVRDSGHFETDRAIAAGRKVAGEVHRGRARGES